MTGESLEELWLTQPLVPLIILPLRFSVAMGIHLTAIGGVWALSCWMATILC